jgi:hypothetical protein
MLIQETPFKHWIDNFYGYGSWDAKIWLIGYEEGGGDLPEEVAEKLNYFYNIHSQNTQPTLCDIRELYRQVVFRVDGPKGERFANLHDYRFDSNAALSSVWKNLAAFGHGYRHKPLPDDLLAYQRHSFASLTGAEALIQFYPLPSPHSHAWYYSWLDLPKQFSFLKTRASYEAHVYEDRMNTILHKISAYKPDIVLMYGMNNINALKKSVQDVFQAAKFKAEKAVKLQTPQYHQANLNGTTLVITTQIPALKHNRIETGFDWEAFGKLVKSKAI